MKKLFFGTYFILLTLVNVALSADVGDSGIKVYELTKASSSWDGGVLNYQRGKPQITIERIIFPPGSQSLVHRHPVVSAAILLKGKLTVITENKKTLHLKAGEAFVEVENKWHYGKNEGNEPAELVFFHAGTKGLPVTVLKPKTSSGIQIPFLDR